NVCLARTNCCLSPPAARPTIAPASPGEACPIPPITQETTMHPVSIRGGVRRLVAVLLGAVLGAAGSSAHSAFPEKPVTLVVPFAPGGGTDAISRSLAEGMSKDLGQPVIVENRPGAGTVIGTNYVARSQPDGYTLVMATFAHAVNPFIHPNLPFDTAKAFAPVALVAHSPNILVVNPEQPFHSVKELLDY